MAGEDYYETLGIPRNADDAEIKKAYRSLARKFHPDICKEPGAEEKFKKINEAYSVLSDEQKKRQYDNMGRDLHERIQGILYRWRWIWQRWILCRFLRFRGHL
jgi:molecular chaperone DnaJ